MTLSELNAWFYDEVLWRVEFRRESLKLKWNELSTQDKERLFHLMAYRIKACDKMELSASEIVYEIFDTFKPQLITTV